MSSLEHWATKLGSEGGGQDKGSCSAGFVSLQTLPGAALCTGPAEKDTQEVFMVQLGVRVAVAGAAWCALQRVEGPRVPPPAINRAGGENRCPGGPAGEQWLIDGDSSSPEWPEQYLDLQRAGVIGCNCRLVKFPAGVSEQGVAVKRPATSFLLH